MIFRAFAAAALLLPLLAAAAEPGEAIDLEDCRISAGPGYPGIKARCGILLRPLNPDDRNSPLIDLNVAIVPALTLEPAPDPLVPIAGGPGQASSEFYAAYAGAFEEIRRDRDIVLLDQRGTGQSTALECPEQEDAVAADIDDAAIVAATRECLDGLPYDPRYFTTSVAVRDLEALRRELGYAQFNIYGVSYGTRVAQHFLRRYPDSTRTVILDGVVPPQLALGPDIALEAQRALEHTFDRCAEDDACNAHFPQLAGRFDELYAALATPRQVELPNPRTGRPHSLTFGQAELAGAVRLLSYQANTIALLPLLIHTAAQGNLQPLAAQFVMSTDAITKAMSFGMHNAIVCTEDVPFIDPAGIDQDALANTYIGPVMTDSLETMCSVWPRGVLDDDLNQPLHSDKPVLLMSGDADPITPPGYAERAAAELGNAQLLVGHGQGHGQAIVGCVPDIMADFVATASVNDLDLACMERQFPMPFFIDFSGPAP